MDKNIKDYLHLYLGSEVVYLFKTRSADIDKIYEKRTGKLIGVGENGVVKTVTVATNHGIEHLREVDIKLILRPLSDMTEDEINELWSRLELNPDYENNIEGSGNTKKKYITEYFTREPIWPATYERFDFKKNCILIYFLLSKHFDLFDLISAEIAIDKTKI